MQENKLGITSEESLMITEERISKLRAREIFDKGMLKKFEIGTFAGLAEIHKYLFGDIYDTAGQLRTVNIARGNTRFIGVTGLGTELEFVNIMPFDTFDDIVDKYIEMNIAHPFRYGNGRAMRIWLNAMLSAKLGAVVDYSAISKEDYVAALEMSSLNDSALNNMLRAALTHDLGRDVYMRGVDASYAFEGFTNFVTQNL